MSKISVIICHHQGTLIFDACKSLRASRDVDCELVVMTSVPDLKIPDADRVVHCPGGPALKRNESLKWTAGSLLAFFDDDVLVNPMTVREMAHVFTQDPFCGMVFGKLLKMDDGTTFDEAGSFMTRLGFLWARGDRVKDTGQFEKTEPILAGKSAACMIKRKVFVGAGLFDPSYEILAEETDLAWRVWLSGHKVLFCPRSVTLHAFNTRFKTIDFYTKKRVYYNGCRNYISMLATNLNVWNLITILPVHVLLWGICAAGMILRGRFEEGGLILKGILYNLKRIDWILIKREKVKKIRKVSDSFLFMIWMRTPAPSYYSQRFFRYLKNSLHG